MNYAESTRDELYELALTRGLEPRKRATRDQLVEMLTKADAEASSDVEQVADEQPTPENEGGEAGEPSEAEDEIHNAELDGAAEVPETEVAESTPETETVVEKPTSDVEKAKAAKQWFEKAIGNGVRNARETRALMLQALLRFFEPDASGAVFIPAKALEEVGFAKSAWTHGPYWKSNGPGATAAYDIKWKAGISKNKGETRLKLWGGKLPEAEAEVEVEEEENA